MSEEDMIYTRQYFGNLTMHKSERVRKAAIDCLRVVETREWRSRYKRQLLDELAWALHDYIKDDSKTNA